MRVTREGGMITLRDRAGPHWLLGLFLLSGGLLGIAMPLGLATNAGELEHWERLAALIVGIGVSAGAIWYLTQCPATVVQLDLTRRQLTLTRTGLNGRQVRQLSFTELTSVELAERKDSDGDPMWRPVIRLGSGETLLMSDLWSHDHKAVLAGAAVLAESCRLPVRSSGGDGAALC